MANNPFALLINDHKKLKDVMSRMEKSLEGNSKHLEDEFDEFKNIFGMHDHTEDHIVYPVLKKHSALEKLVLKGYQAHHMVEVGILELKITPFRSETWGPKFLVIKDSILSHMREEEKTLFPQALKLISKENLKKMQGELVEERQ